MKDQFDRKIHYLRISVTDKCNLRCHYCMPEEGVKLLRHEDVLTLEEIADFTRIAVEMGVNKVRLTGGEPLVRRGIVSLVEALSKIAGIRDLAMTTNGVSLDKFAEPLYNAGLQRLNVSLDTLDPGRYREITRGGDVADVLKGLEIAKETGFSPIKINAVVDHGRRDPDVKLVKAYAEKNGFQIRYISRMDLAKGEFWAVSGGDGGVCSKCNRLRLTSNGLVKPCLFSDIGYSVRELGARAAITQAIQTKPEKGAESQTNTFYAVGG
ncbi:MAG: radical SAM protein [SAR324 cluster bacterium]|nr:radical SAM protein [SAR324 cluster bacterium]